MKRWSVGAKITTISAAGALLGFSFCGGPKVVVVGYDSSLERAASALFMVSAVGLVVGILIWFVQGISGGDK
jgi:hypothetical protein